MKKILTAVMFAAIVLSGCSKSDDLEDGGNGNSNGVYGTLKLSVSENSSLTTVKSGDSDALSGYSVVFTKESDAEYSLEYTYDEIIELGSLELYPGSYTVTVSDPDALDVAWDQPVYSGSADFTIVKDAITEVSVVCTIQNMKVTVTLSETFVKEFAAYNILVSGTYDEQVKSLAFDQDVIEAGTAAWFGVSDLTVTIKGQRSNGDNMELSETITGTAAAEHHIISIDAQGTGSADVDIEVSDDVTDSTTEVTVPGFEETPVEDEEGDTGDGSDTGDGDTEGDGSDTGDGSTEGDGDDTSTTDPNTPALIWEANPTFETTTITTSTSTSVELVVSAPNGIETFLVGIDSDLLEPVITQMGEMLSIDLTNNPYDLINDEAAMYFLGDMMGLPVGDELSGQTSVNFILTDLVAMIPQLENSAGTTHTFTLYATDAQGLSLEQSLTFVVPAE